MIAERSGRVQSALNQLGLADRVALKLVNCPMWIDDEEVRWLAERAGLQPEVVISQILEAEDTFQLTLIYDPDFEGSEDREGRRKRMERFRRRRTRARDKLLVILTRGEG